MSENIKGHWAIAYHTNSDNPRSQKWYYVTRMVKVDGKWWELYRWSAPAGHKTVTPNNRKAVREFALEYGLALLHGVFTSAPAPRQAGEMVWSIDQRPRDIVLSPRSEQAAERRQLGFES